MMKSFTMKSTSLGMLVLLPTLLGSCDRPKTSSFTVEMGHVARESGCHVNLMLIRYFKDGSPMGDFRFVCDVPESALKEKNWWGDQTQPMMNSLAVNDCMRLKKTWYCVESIEPGKSATLRATFQTIDSDFTLMERIK